MDIENLEERLNEVQRKLIKTNIKGSESQIAKDLDLVLLEKSRFKQFPFLREKKYLILNKYLESGLAIGLRYKDIIISYLLLRENTTEEKKILEAYSIQPIGDLDYLLSQINWEEILFNSYINFGALLGYEILRISPHIHYESECRKDYGRFSRYFQKFSKNKGFKFNKDNSWYELDLKK